MIDGKCICILIEEGFEDIEVVEPLRVLKDFGAKVLLINLVSGPTYRGKRGNAMVKIDFCADEVKAGDFDAIIIPGGTVADKMHLNNKIINLLKEANDAGKVIAAISEGPQLLIWADIAQGRCLTSLPSISADLKNAGADWVDEPVVKDGNLITARRPADVPRFNRAIIDMLSE
jgi:protease I